MATTKEIRISQLPLEKDIRGMMTVGVNSANQSVRVPLGEVINEEISKVKRTYNYARIDALTVGSSADDVASALIAENESKRTMPNVGDILVDWGGVIRVPVVRQSVQTGGEKPIYSFSFRTADNTATKTVTIQGYLYEPQMVVSVETVKDVAQQQISSLDTQLAEEATARLNQDDVLEAKITNETNARTNADKVLTDNLAKEITDRTNAIKAEQTARVQADTAINGEIQGIKDKGTLHDLFLASGATYNQDTKMYQLNGLDLTFNEMKACYYFTYPIQFSNNWKDICNSRYFKTNVARNSHLGTFVPIILEAAFVYCKSLIKLNFLIDVNYLKAGRSNMAFMECTLLESIIGIDFSNATGYDDLAGTFDSCRNLKELKIKGIANDVSFADSPLLTKESIIDIIKNATPSSPITITLHPTAYAMATADPEIQAELEKQPNISLAEGVPTV